MKNTISHYTTNAAAFSMLLAPERKIQEKLLGEMNNLISGAGLVPNFQIKDGGYNAIASKAKRNAESSFLDIRFSTVSKLNDTSEFQHGKQLVEEAVRKIVPQSENIRKWVDFVLSALSSEAILKALRENTYILSMSTLRNDLNQWRLYGDDGRGVSLVFDHHQIAEIYRTIVYTGTESVKYGKREIAKYLDVFSTTRFELPAEFATITNMPQLGHLDASEVGKALMLFSVISRMLFLKNDAYKAEKEVRIIYNPIFIGYITGFGKTHNSTLLDYLPSFRDDIRQFDISNNQIYYYKLMPIPKRCLKEIWLGPKNPNSKEIMRNYLQYNGYTEVEVIKSDLPYR